MRGSDFLQIFYTFSCRQHHLASPLPTISFLLSYLHIRLVSARLNRRHSLGQRLRTNKLQSFSSITPQKNSWGFHTRHSWCNTRHDAFVVVNIMNCSLSLCSRVTRFRNMFVRDSTDLLDRVLVQCNFQLRSKHVKVAIIWKCRGEQPSLCETHDACEVAWPRIILPIPCAFSQVYNFVSHLYHIDTTKLYHDPPKETLTVLQLRSKHRLTR